MGALKIICNALDRVADLVLDRDEGEITNGFTIAIHGILSLSQYYRDLRIRSQAVAFGLIQILAVMRACTQDGGSFQEQAFVDNENYFKCHQGVS